LFGHEKGAFTGATSERKGYFETVDGGTIFLDEIGEMPSDTQAFLLRVLETGEFLRVGSSQVQRTNVRVIAATNVDLMEKVRKGKFREDLFYRLNTVPIKVPSLKERPEDIHLLFRKFTTDFAEKYRTSPIHLDEKAQVILENYSWPGNVRELKNMAEQLSVLSENKEIRGEDLLEHYPQFMQRNLPMIPENRDKLSSMEEREILYNLLFEMKKDLNDLKSIVFGLIQNNNLSVPDQGNLNRLKEPAYPAPYPSSSSHISEQSDHSAQDAPEDLPYYRDSENVRLIIEKEEKNGYHSSEEVEENLSLEEMEKELIQKALRKHRGRRRDAANELGISERTLYRKIKHYKI
jgi:DNA-binding NtrC family response regulator